MIRRLYLQMLLFFAELDICAAEQAGVISPVLYRRAQEIRDQLAELSL